MSSKSDNVLSTFYSDKLDQQLALYQNLLGRWDSYLDPQFNWTNPWLHWNSLFYENAQKEFLSSKSDSIKYFLLRPARSTISPLSEPTRTMTLLRRPSIQLNKSLTALKFTFYENAQKKFLSSKSDNVLSTFYSDQLDQQLAL